MAALLYAAALLIVSVGAAQARLSYRDLIGAQLAVSLAYLVWLFVALIPAFKRRAWRVVSDDSRTGSADAHHAGPDQRGAYRPGGNVPAVSAPRRLRVRVSARARHDLGSRVADD